MCCYIFKGVFKYSLLVQDAMVLFQIVPFILLLSTFLALTLPLGLLLLLVFRPLILTRTQILLVAPDTEAGYVLGVVAERNDTPFFYDYESYHDPRWKPFIDQRTNRMIHVYHSGAIPPNTSVFLSQELEAREQIPFDPGASLASYTPYIYKNSCVAYRFNGVKVLTPKNDTCTTFTHHEVEWSSGTYNVNHYRYGRMIQRTTISINATPLTIFVPPGATRAYILHLAGPLSLPITVFTGNWSTTILAHTPKLQFVETTLVFPRTSTLVFSAPNQSLISPEIDWIEFSY